MTKAESYLSEGCFIAEWSNTPDDPAVSIARARVPPGVTTRWHCLKSIVERYAILEGNGRVYIGDAGPRNVQPGDVVLIPADVRQRITNTGAGDLVFLAICTPRFIPTAYQELETLFRKE
jgi:mannose-6-phosphate isomerase-like protein (cupin superfamily)